MLSIIQKARRIEECFNECILIWEQEGAPPIKIYTRDTPTYEEANEIINTAKRKNTNKIRFQLQLNGLKRAGIKTFNQHQDATMEFNEWNYILYVGENTKHPINNLYDQYLSDAEIEFLAKEFVTRLVEKIEHNVSKA